MYLVLYIKRIKPKTKQMILTKKPESTFLVRLTKGELNSMKTFAEKRNMSVNQCFRTLANNLMDSEA